MNTTSVVHPIDCDAAVRRLWDYLDEELDGPRLAEMEQHLNGCAACTEHVRFAERFVAAVHDAWPAVGETGSLRQRIVTRLRAEGFQAA